MGDFIGFIVVNVVVVFIAVGVSIVVTETKDVRIEMYFTWRKEKECCKADAKLQKISDLAKDF